MKQTAVEWLEENTIHLDYECQECALIAVDLILDEYWLWLHDTERKEYWNEVKKEIEKL